MADASVALLLSCYTRLYAACRRLAHGDGELSHHQVHILDQLGTSDLRTVGELAQRLGVTPSTMSLTIDRLARSRLVERVRDRHDARRVRLRLTPAGRRAREAESLLDPVRVGAILALLSPEQTEQLTNGLVLLGEALPVAPNDPLPKPHSRRTDP